MLTIDEIKDIQFRRGKGYRNEDVDAFIDEVILTVEQMKKEKSELIRKMDILATRVEQYRADEETVRNALLSAQRVADQTVKEAKAKAASIISEAETKSNSMLKEANALTVKQKEIYLKLKSDSVVLRGELESLYNKHLKSLNELPTDAAVARKKEELDRKYPTTPVEEPAQESAEEPEQKVESPAEETFEPVNPSSEYFEESKFSNLKFGENYDVDAD